MSMMGPMSSGPQHHRYLAVLVLILATLVFTMAAPVGDGSRVVVVTLQAATLFAAVFTARAHPWMVRAVGAVCLVVVLASVGAVLGTENLGSDSARMTSLLLVALAPPVIVYGMVQHVREEHRVTLQTMFGVLCIYLLFGMLFSTLYTAIQGLSNDPFFKSGFGDPSDFLYFSFATLTTVGYGDLVAASSLGRSLAISEALIGQIYMVTVVALIVSNMRPAPSSPQAGSGPPPPE